MSEIVDGVERRLDRVVLTRNGRPAAVIMSPDDLEAVEDALDILSDPSAMAAISAAEHDIENARFVTAEDLKRTYLER